MAVFGMGDKTGIDLPGEADTSSLVYTAENMGPTDLATNAFGQNYNCTMVQMSAALCSVINGGSYYEPHVVKQILNEQGSVVEKKEPVLVRETVSQSTAEFLKQAMFETVETGTGGAAKVAGYHVGGKTGTAEKQPRSAKNYLVSFAGFAPVEDPELFVYVVIDTPNYPPGEEQAHSSYASAIFAKIMSEALPYLNVFPAEELPDSEDVEGSLPEQEGIHADIPEETEETQETKKVYETDEYVDIGEEGSFDSGVPDAVPIDPDRESDGFGPQGPAAAPLAQPANGPAAASTESETGGEETASSSEASNE